MKPDQITELRKLFGDGVEGLSVGHCVAVLSMIDEQEEMKALLGKLEWQEYDGETRCPICEGFKPGTTTYAALAGLQPHPPAGHKLDCDLAALIAEP